MDQPEYLVGQDPTENIVGSHPVFDNDATYMRLYFRDGDTVNYDDFRLYPFFFANLEAVKIADNSSINASLTKLNGQNEYNYMVVCGEWSDYKQLLNEIYNRLGYPAPEVDEDGDLDYDHRKVEEIKTPGSITSQFFMQTGKTFFKGMAFKDVYRMQIDIETYTEGDFPNASREEDKITIISMSDNRGWEKVLHLKPDEISHKNGLACTSEKALLQELVEVVQLKDPDVIEMHNGFGFDLPYIMERCDLHDVPFAVGRDKSEPHTFETSRRFAERTIDYEMASINGRTVIDTWFQVMAYDVYARDMPSHTLKESAKYFDVVPEGRTYVEGSEIPRLWREEPQKLLDYALDDVRETRGVAEQLSGSTFYLTQMLPFSYQDADRYGTATIIEGLFIREYLRQRESVPEPSEGVQSSGGYTDLYMQGVIDRLVYADVASLYPAIMLNYRCEPGQKKDPINLFHRCLDKLTELRLDAKAEMNRLSDKIEKLEEQETDIPESMPNPNKAKIKRLKKERDELDARQSSYKIQINSFYGAMGFRMFAWNNIAEADRVAETGQDLLKLMIREIEKDGGTIIEVDTDGVIFSPIDPKTGKNEMGLADDREVEAQYVRDLTERMPEGIEIDHDGSFERMVSYKKKNYALKKYGSDDIKLKGGSIISRSMEPFGREFVSRVIDALMERDVQEIHDIYVETVQMIKTSDWDVEDFQRTETLKETPDEYEEKIRLGPGNGGYHRQARYEVAKKEMQRTGEPWEIGDRVSYYIANGRELRKLKTYQTAKHVDRYEGDEHTEYYLRDRLEKFASKFTPFFDEFAFQQVFNAEVGLFGFDADMVEMKPQRVRPPLLNSTDDLQEIPEPVE